MRVYKRTGGQHQAAGNGQAFERGGNALQKAVEEATISVAHAPTVGENIRTGQSALILVAGKQNKASRMTGETTARERKRERGNTIRGAKQKFEARTDYVSSRESRQVPANRFRGNEISETPFRVCCCRPHGVIRSRERKGTKTKQEQREKADQETFVSVGKPARVQRDHEPRRLKRGSRSSFRSGTRRADTRRWSSVWGRRAGGDS